MQQWKRVSTKQMLRWQQLMQRLLETLLAKDKKGINLNSAQIAMFEVMTGTTVMQKEEEKKITCLIGEKKKMAKAKGKSANAVDKESVDKEEDN